MVLDTPELLEKAAACQPRFARDGSIFGAPLIFLVCSVTNDAWVRPYDQMNSSAIDTSIVCDQMMMEAEEQGLGTCWVCHFKPRWPLSSSTCPRVSIPIICSSVAILPTISPTPSIERLAPFPSPTSSSSRFLGHALKSTFYHAPFAEFCATASRARRFVFQPACIQKRSPLMRAPLTDTRL